MEEEEDLRNFNFHLNFTNLLNDSMFLTNLSTFLDGDGGYRRGGANSPMLPYKYELGLPVQIGLYSTIFLLAVVGNSLVILTLVQNQGMRTITNLFLLNLAIADLLVGVFCMPFSLVGVILKDFVFGPFLCKLIPYLQAVSVAVSAWTLVAISVERYYAICHPLTSRRWQTLSHAYKIIAIVWIASLTCMSPIAFVSVLQPIRRTGRHKCREAWPDEVLEKTYTVFLDIILLVCPLLVMAVKYGLITRTLWPAASNTQEQYLNEHSSMLAASGGDDSVTPSPSPRLPNMGGGGGGTGTPAKNLMMSNNSNNAFSFTASFRRTDSSRGSKNKKNEARNMMMAPLTPTPQEPGSGSLQETSIMGTHPPPLSPGPNSNANANVNGNKGLMMNSSNLFRQTSAYGGHPHGHHPHTTTAAPTSTNPAGILRRCNQAKSLKRKKRVIQMLGVVVAEFFVCWTPLYVMNTWYLFSPEELYEMIGHVGVSLIQLLAYISCCCNPITLCVMSRGFRIAFCHVFGCHYCENGQGHGGGRSNGHGGHTSSQRNDSVRLTRNRSIYTPTFCKTTHHNVV